MKKGFTLIELLAVIVILAIIALIASPIIIGLIDDARKESFKNTTYGIIGAGEILYSKDLLNETKEDIIFTYNDGVETSSIEGKTLEYNGTKPKSGNVVINSKGQIAIVIHNGTYCSVKGYEESEVTLFEKSKEECKINLSFVCGDIFIDERDWNEYATVQIGEQCWMAENLRYTGNGCLNNTWDSSPLHNACNTHQAGEGEELGDYNSWTETQVLYQWEVANTVCPEGWKLPTDAEWTILVSNLASEPGNKLKSKDYWNGESTENGFNALPAGNRNSVNTLYKVGSNGFWWSSSSCGSNVCRRYLSSDNYYISSNENSPAKGSSVRCLFEQ